MTRSWIAAGLALAFAAMPLPALSAPKVTYYRCDATPVAWIWPPYIIGVDETHDLVAVIDGVINKFNDKKPVAAEVVENSAAKLVFRWKIDVIDPKGVHVRLNFEATYFKNLNQFTVNGYMSGYANKFFTQGKCRVIQR